MTSRRFPHSWQPCTQASYANRSLRDDYAQVRSMPTTVGPPTHRSVFAQLQYTHQPIYARLREKFKAKAKVEGNLNKQLKTDEITAVSQTDTYSTGLVGTTLPLDPTYPASNAFDVPFTRDQYVPQRI